MSSQSIQAVDTSEEILPSKSRTDMDDKESSTIDQQNDSGIDIDGTCVQVAVRVRPMLPNERQDASATDCVDVFSSDSKRGTNVIRLGGETGPKFTFDQVFGSDTFQSQVYEDRVAPLVENCLEGYNATVLAYGQTGSGKTHTIMGPSSSMTTAMLSDQEREQAGVIPRAIRSIFHQLQRLATSNTATDGHDSAADTSDSTSYEYEVRIQFLEVYGEDIRDLLNPQQGTTSSKLSIRDVGNEEPEVVGATEHKVDSAEEALLCLTRGMYRRVTGSTAMNESSSRSHAILSLIVEQTSVLSEEQSPDDDNEVHTNQDKSSKQQQHVQMKKSKFNFVDLAGSERQKRTQASGQRLKEGIDINKGLLVLGNVISALGDPKKQGKTFVPYRDSKLTRLLKGSLGGNHKTLMIACVSPSSTNVEETLNCLRYANRAKNIQNHAIVNVDATSALVADLKLKVQRLADDLLKARTGKISECSIPLAVIKSLSAGDEDSEQNRWLTSASQNPVSPSPRNSFCAGWGQQGYDSSHDQPPAYIPAMYSLKSENEALRVQLAAAASGSDSSDALQAHFAAKTTEYENQILHLKRMLQQKSETARKGRTNTRSSEVSAAGESRSESPELSRLKSQMFGSLSKFSTLDAEVEAEERSVKDLSEKYLSLDNEIIDEEDLGTPTSVQVDTQNIEFEEDNSVLLEADLCALSTSISAKEELIKQLQSSQQKYESMREFYEEKLQEMEEMLSEKVLEAEKLSVELKKHDIGNVKGKELSEKLKKNQAQVLELKKKQAELSRLTTVASRNESQISRLRDEIRNMKSRKVDLQKQIVSERKTHKAEVLTLKKESMKKDRELTKALRENTRISQEATRVQNVAKSRLDQISHLKSKYKETEKRRRMQTIKHGVLAKAGLNPVLVGRRQSTSKDANVKKNGVNIDSLRDLFDQKVADVSRREHLAMKVAQEWEEHFDLTAQKEMLQSNGGNEESIQAIESQIQYREDRIRSIASRLGKRDSSPKDKDNDAEEGFLFDDDFEKIVFGSSDKIATRTAANVLFGMVVRERRRIASLARTASQLDEKVQEAEAAAAAKDAAFRAYVDEQRLEAASLAQNQQEHILSLMEMVKETRDDEIPTAAKYAVSSDGNSKLLVLANERVAVLERQLHETTLSRDAVQKHREREESARSLLEEKKKECEELEEEIDELRLTYRRIREELNRGGGLLEEIDASRDDSLGTVLRKVQDMVTNALHPASSSIGSTSRRRRSSSSPLLGQSPSLTPKIRRETQLTHSSDSEEMPDWADDIMADLAIIAEGKIPASLLNSKMVLDAENHLNGNVFDRLTDPDGFTGVQKQKSVQPVRSSRGKSSSATEAGPKRRDQSSQQVAESLGKLKKKDSTGRKSKDKRASNPGVEKRSVFDRLLSPSNLTGTQKQKFHDKKGRDLDKAIENQHVATRVGKAKTSDCENEVDPLDGQAADYLLEELLINDVQGNGDRRSDSSKDRHQDVFERLNRTTTAAYAVKQNTNIAERLLDDLLHSSDSNQEDESDNPKCELKFERLEEYQKQDVFERLQRTTTEAYAQKKNTSISYDDHQYRPHGASPVSSEKIHQISSSPNQRRVTRSQSRS